MATSADGSEKYPINARRTAPPDSYKTVPAPQLGPWSVAFFWTLGGIGGGVVCTRLALWLIAL